MSDIDSLNLLTMDFGRSLYQGFYDIIKEFTESHDPKKKDALVYKITAVVANSARTDFNIIWHTKEQTFYMFSAQERVYLPFEREQFVNNGLAIFDKAHEDVLAAISKPWSHLLLEKDFRKYFKEGLRAYLGDTDGEQESDYTLFQNCTVPLDVAYAPEDIAPGGKLFLGKAPDHTLFHTHTLNASLVPVTVRPTIWEKACKLMGFEVEAMMNALEDILLYLLTPSLKREEMFYWFGRGSNGKSVLIKFLTGVVGARHTASVSLDDLQDSSFAWHALLGKRLNLPSESGSAYVESEKLKAVITGDQITINRKNKDHISVVLPVKFVFAMNRQPVFSERTHAIYRRFRMVVFDREVADHEKIVDFHQVLLDHRDEIVSWCLINHLKRHGKFTPQFALPDIFETWRQDALQGETDPMVLFVEDCLQFIDDASLEVDIQSVRNSFKSYCTGNNMDTRRWSDNVIGKKLNDEFNLISKRDPKARHAAKGSEKVTRNNAQKRIYRGLRLINQA